MAYIGRPSIVGNFVKLDAISVVNGQAAYTMQNGSANFTDYSTVNQFMVSLNGTIQSPGSSFTVSGSTITFASNLVTNDVIDFIIVFGNSLSSGVPTDATVSTAKIVDDAVTAAKINNDIISGSTELASEPADTDEFLVSDAGTLKRIDYSLIKGGGKVLQVVFGSTSTETRNNTNTLADTGLSASITPSATSSKVLIIVMQNGCDKTAANAGNQMILKLLRGSTQISTLTNNGGYSNYAQPLSFGTVGGCLLDEPSSTSALTYKTQFSCGNNTAGVGVQGTGGENSHITLIEIGA